MQGRAMGDRIGSSLYADNDVKALAVKNIFSSHTSNRAQFTSSQVRDGVCKIVCMCSSECPSA